MVKKLKETIVGNDGKLSSRKLTALLCIILMTITTVVLWLVTSEDMVLFYVITLHGVFALLLLGIITVQNIIAFKHGYNKEENEHKRGR